MSIFKTVAPVEDKRSSRKRAAGDNRSEYSQKRPKLRPKVVVDIKDAQSVCDYDKFRFLELPPEIRNQIYEYAIEYTHRCFPMLHKMSTKVRKQAVSPWSSESTDPSGSMRRPIPYLALTQTCLQIRAEFRPMWLPTHRIPLSFMDTYLKTFFPTRMPTGQPLKPHTLGTSGLRIWVRRDELGSGYCHDATRLFRHKARFPDCAVTCQSLSHHLNEDRILRDLERIINHDNAAWRKSVNGGRVSQLRLGLHFDWEAGEIVAMDIVVKEKFAEPWMKVLSAPPPKSAMERFLWQFGFDLERFSFHVRVAVDYS